MNDVVPFNFENFSVRVVLLAGVPWWVASDVCKVLEIVEGRRAVSRLDDEDKGGHSMTTPGGPQTFTIINESGLYSLILTSRKEAAKRFKRWVTSEVLPSIRKHGGYIAGQESMEPAEVLARAVLVANSVIAVGWKGCGSCPHPWTRDAPLVTPGPYAPHKSHGVRQRPWAVRALG